MFHTWRWQCLFTNTLRWLHMNQASSPMNDSSPAVKVSGVCSQLMPSAGRSRCSNSCFRISRHRSSFGCLCPVVSSARPDRRSATRLWSNVNCRALPSPATCGNIFPSYSNARSPPQSAPTTVLIIPTDWFCCWVHGILNKSQWESTLLFLLTS